MPILFIRLCLACFAVRVGWGWGVIVEGEGSKLKASHTIDDLLHCEGINALKKYYKSG